jgi:hypothetical protein
LLFSPASAPAAREPFLSEGSAFVLIVGATAALLFNGGLRPYRPDLENGIKLLASGPIDRRVSDGQRILYGPPAGPWAGLDDDPDEREALRFLRSKTSPADPLFVGVADHSRLFCNDVRAYWLADRPVGVRYMNFDPGIVTEAKAQNEMIADLGRRNVGYALIFDEKLPGGPSGSRLLDEYLASHFRVMARFGDFTVLNRAAP